MAQRSKYGVTPPYFGHRKRGCEATSSPFVYHRQSCGDSSRFCFTYEYKYLLASLIEAVPFVSNTTGTYGAYLKTWDKRAYKRLELVKLGVLNNSKRNICYNEDANELIKKISGDILYIDPPYNERQY